MGKTAIERAILLTSRASSNIILAKARAMFGRSLKANDYMALTNCHSVGEVASYLKSNTAYSAVLSEINETTIHRGYLEQLLHRQMYEDYTSLARYDTSLGNQSFKWLLLRTEAELLITSLRLISADKSQELVFSLPASYTSRSRIDVTALTKSKNYDDFLNALKNTEYPTLLAKFAPYPDEPIPIGEIENLLYTIHSNTAFDIINSSWGDEKKELEDLLGTYIDGQNINRILRLKRFFIDDYEQISKNLLPHGTLSEKTINQMVSAKNQDQVMDIFLSTRLGKSLPGNIKKISVYDLQRRLPYINARRHIRYSLNPSVVMFSYIIIKDIELNDITNIIEGIRYGLKPKEIENMLVPV